MVEASYNSISDALEKAEQSSGPQATLLLDPNEALASQITISDYDYEKAVKTISGIENLLLEQQAAAQKSAIQMPNINVNMGGVTNTASQIRQKIEGADLQKRMLVLDSEMINAAKEIGSIIGGAGRELEEQISEEIYKIKTSKLVIPGLSLQDQIHELEGIEDGLNQKAFDSEQLKIIRQEVSGVEEAVKRASSQVIDESQKDLVEVRTRLVSEIRNKLLNSNN